MNNHKTEFLKRIKESYKIHIGKRRNLLLPSDIAFTIEGMKLRIHLTAEATCINMQTDSAAFEGWVLVAKRWGQFKKIILHWNKPAELTNGHYQRFLFRVKNFSNYFNSWFEIDEKCNDYFKDLQIKKDNKYYLNQPSKNRDNRALKSEEAKLENEFVYGIYHEQLVKLTNADFIDRQLPVGIFKDSVKKGNEIFPRSKSAIDLWGISKKNELLIFELKANRNNKVGIISELSFYISVMESVKSRFFLFEKSDDNLNRIRKTVHIKSYFLAPELHPLIDKRLADEINLVMQPEIEFHFIQILGPNLKLIF